MAHLSVGKRVIVGGIILAAGATGLGLASTLASQAATRTDGPYVITIVDRAADPVAVAADQCRLRNEQLAPDYVVRVEPDNLRTITYSCESTGSTNPSPDPTVTR